jgi:hypothetical protein
MRAHTGRRIHRTRRAWSRRGARPHGLEYWAAFTSRFWGETRHNGPSHTHEHRPQGDVIHATVLAVPQDGRSPSSRRRLCWMGVISDPGPVGRPPGPHGLRWTGGAGCAPACPWIRGGVRVAPHVPETRSEVRASGPSLVCGVLYRRDGDFAGGGDLPRRPVG